MIWLRPLFDLLEASWQTIIPNKALHMTEAGYLTEISKRMMGDKE